MTRAVSPEMWESVHALRRAADSGGQVLVNANDLNVVLKVFEKFDRFNVATTLQRAEDYDGACRLLGDAMRWAGLKV